MRFLFVLFILLFSCSSDAQLEPVEKSPGVYDYEQSMSMKDLTIMRAILKEYAPDARVFVIGKQPLSFFVGGLANKIGEHSYLIQFNSNNPLVRSTMYHELGHVIDSENGILDFKGDMYWHGHKCDFKIEWSERPWEISANQWRDCLEYEYLNRELKYYDYTHDYVLEWFGL